MHLAVQHRRFGTILKFRTLTKIPILENHDDFGGQAKRLNIQGDPFYKYFDQNACTSVSGGKLLRQRR
jgi:hypothetical protein